MDWIFVVAYVGFVLLLIGVLSATPTLASLADFGCALSGDAASIHNFSGVHGAGCGFGGDHVGSVRLVGRVSVSGGIITYEWVGK